MLSHQYRNFYDKDKIPVRPYTWKFFFVLKSVLYFLWSCVGSCCTFQWGHISSFHQYGGTRRPPSLSGPVDMTSTFLIYHSLCHSSASQLILASISVTVIGLVVAGQRPHVLRMIRSQEKVNDFGRKWFSHQCWITGWNSVYLCGVIFFQLMNK